MFWFPNNKHIPVTVLNVINNIRYYWYFYTNYVRFKISNILLAQLFAHKVGLFFAIQPKSLLNAKILRKYSFGTAMCWLLPMIFSPPPKLSDNQFTDIARHGVVWLFIGLLYDNPYKKLNFQPSFLKKNKSNSKQKQLVLIIACFKLLKLTWKCSFFHIIG